MADFKVHIDETTGITFVEITGNLGYEEHLSFLKSDAYRDRTMRVVVDMRNASLIGLPRGKLAKLVRSFRSLGKAGIMIAFIFSKADGPSKGKILLAQLETLGFEGTFRVFTDTEKATIWVQK